MTAVTRSQGFSLIELMIVVAIIGILAAIAYPGYEEYVRKSRRAECAAVLSGTANAMERRFSTANTYETDVDPDPALPNPAQCPRDGGAASYILAFAAGEPTATSFALEATPAGAQAGDKCGTLTLDNTGLKGLKDAKVGTTVRECW